MGRAVITITDNGEPGEAEINLDLFTGEDNAEPGSDNNSTAHRMATFMLHAVEGTAVQEETD